MFETYLPAAMMIVFAAGVAACMFAFSWAAGFVRRSGTSREVYECGMPLLDEAEKKISVRYYLVVLLFVVFDTETILLLPFAAAFRDAVREASTAGAALGELVVFIAILFVGYIYVVRKGSFRWD